MQWCSSRMIIRCTLCKKEIRLDPRIRNEHWYHRKCVMQVDVLLWYMTNLAVNGIIGFIILGIIVLIVYFVYPTFEYLLPIGSILIIIGLVTILQIKMQKRFWFFKSIVFGTKYSRNYGGDRVDSLSYSCSTRFKNFEELFPVFNMDETIQPPAPTPSFA